MPTSSRSALALLCLVCACHMDVKGQRKAGAADADDAPASGDASTAGAGDGDDASNARDAALDGMIDGAVEGISDGGPGNTSDGARQDGGNPPCVPGSASDGSCGFARRRQITFEAALLAEALESFPVLVVLDATRIDYQQMQPDGRDLRFIDEDGKTLLAHEVERWDVNGKSYVWVKVPRVRARSATDHMFMVYGNDNALNAERPQDVWSNGYVGVWHLSEVPSTGPSLKDSTGVHPGTASASMNSSDRVEGRVAFATEFDGIDHVVELGAIETSGWTEVTFEALVSSRAKDKAAVLCQADALAQEPVFCLSLSDQKVMIDIATAGAKGESKSYDVKGSTNDAFQHIAVSWRAATGALHVYRNGQLLEELSHAGTGLKPSTQGMTLGRLSALTGLHLDGTIDEVRISNVARSATWIAAEAYAMDGKGLLFGAEETLP